MSNLRISAFFYWCGFISFLTIVFFNNAICIFLAVGLLLIGCIADGYESREKIKAEAERQAKVAAEKAEAERQAKVAAEKAEIERQAKVAAEKAEVERQAKITSEISKLTIRPSHISELDFANFCSVQFYKFPYYPRLKTWQYYQKREKKGKTNPFSYISRPELWRISKDTIYSYLRHHCTNYEYLLKSINDPEAYTTLKDRVNTMIKKKLATLFIEDELYELIEEHQNKYVYNYRNEYYGENVSLSNYLNTYLDGDYDDEIAILDSYEKYLSLGEFDRGDIKLSDYLNDGYECETDLEMSDYTDEYDLNCNSYRSERVSNSHFRKCKRILDNASWDLKSRKHSTKQKRK